MEDHDTVIALIRKAVPVVAPEDLSRRVMSRISGFSREGARGHDRFFDGRLRYGLFQEPVEPPLYFFFTGFFFLVLGLFLLLAMNFFHDRFGGLAFAGHQPWVAVLTALWLAFMGYVLFARGEAGLPIVRRGLIFYIALTAAYVSVLWRTFQDPLDFLLAAAIAISGFVMGALLFLEICRYGKRTWGELGQNR